MSASLFIYEITSTSEFIFLGNLLHKLTRFHHSYSLGCFDDLLCIIELTFSKFVIVDLHVLCFIVKIEMLLVLDVGEDPALRSFRITREHRSPKVIETSGAPRNTHY